MKNQNMLGVAIFSQKKVTILEQIKKNIRTRYSFMQIVSINPENIVIAKSSLKFNKILSESSIQIIDGIGIVIGGFVLGLNIKERVTGSDFMVEILKEVNFLEPRILLLGGKDKVAEKLAECYTKKYRNCRFLGIEGFKNILAPNKAEYDEIFSIVASYKPHLVFCAFGSPFQEIFFDNYKTVFRGVVCMGVGGGFDFAVGKVKRAPLFVRKAGMEWLFRLILQPWRIKRQLRLLLFIVLVIVEKIRRVF